MSLPVGPTMGETTDAASLVMSLPVGPMMDELCTEFCHLQSSNTDVLGENNATESSSLSIFYLFIYNLIKPTEKDTFVF